MIASATSINPFEAASVPVVAVMACEMLFTHADLKSGEIMLIQVRQGTSADRLCSSHEVPVPASLPALKMER
jgi:hypothetical protein